MMDFTCYTSVGKLLLLYERVKLPQTKLVTSNLGIDVTSTVEGFCFETPTPCDQNEGTSSPRWPRPSQGCGPDVEAECAKDQVCR